MHPERCLASIAAVLFVSTIVALVANAIKAKQIEKLRTQNDELDDKNKFLFEYNTVLEAQREVFCKGTITVTLDAAAVDPKEIERVAALLQHNMKKLDKRKPRF